jgi:hypothetical protein
LEEFVTSRNSMLSVKKMFHLEPKGPDVLLLWRPSLV